MKISVIVPVHNGAHDLRLCLDFLLGSTRLPDEIIIVDDASTDASMRVAYEFAERNSSIRVLEPSGQTEMPRGPAFARNRGVRKASGDVLVFFDADVLVHEDTLQKIEEHFAQNPDVAALFGSYDDSPTARGTITRYKNLLHHWTHQRSRRAAETFWTGCGAIRRDVFERIEGFDESFARPSIEDIELGRRLRRANHIIHSCPEIQVTHGKKWTLSSWLRTDIFARAVPWTQLLAREKTKLPNDLNLDWKSRLSALCAWTTLLCTFLAVFAGAPTNRVLEVAALGALLVWFGCNASLLGFLARRGGIGFGLQAGALHFLYYLYSSATWATVSVAPKLQRRGLTILLLATLFKGIAWSLIVPAWQASDEPQQFLYGQSLLQQRRVFPKPIKTVPLETWLLADAVQFDKIHWQQQTPIDLSDRAGLARIIRRIDNAHRVSRLVPDPTKRLIRSPSFMRYHPPLYPLLLASVQKPLSRVSIRWRLLACRWVSLLLGLCVVALAFGAGREIWPDNPQRALILATLVSFQPMLTFTTATVSNIALEVALFSAILWIGLRVWRNGLDWENALFLAVVSGLGLLTKISFAAVVPVLVALMLGDWKQVKRFAQLRREKIERNELFHDTSSTRSRRHFSLALWFLVFLISIGMSAWWYRHTFGGSNDLVVQAFRDPKNALPAQLKAHARDSFVRFIVRGLFSAKTAVDYGRALVSYWCNFGWPDTRAPLAIWASLSAFTTFAVARVSLWLWRNRRAPDAETPDVETPNAKTGNDTTPVFPVFWLGFASVSLIALYCAIDLKNRLALGGPFGLRGQYYLAPVIGQMTWLMLSLKSWRATPKPNALVAFSWNALSWNARLWILALLMIALNWFCLFAVVAPRYYGRASLPVLLERTTVLQPVSPLVLSLLCVVAVASSAMIALATCSAGNLTATKKSPQTI